MMELMFDWNQEHICIKASFIVTTWAIDPLSLNVLDKSKEAFHVIYCIKSATLNVRSTAIKHSSRRKSHQPKSDQEGHSLEKKEEIDSNVSLDIFQVRTYSS